MSNTVQTIAGEMRRRGVISFARFMELALYCPLCGYYEQEADKIGRRGDYFTSVSVGRLFGELLAFQFAAWLAELGAGSGETSGGFQIVEAGAHDGRLARDILRALSEHHPGTLAALEYGIVEPSPRRQAWQRETLREFAGKVHWFADLDALPEASSGAGGPPRSAESGPRLSGIVFSNELLDALPVRRLGWDAQARRWFEWGVRLDGGRFAWATLRDGEASPEALTTLLNEARLCPPAELLAVLPDEFTVEVCPAASDWWRKAARLLRHGQLLTLDYGLEGDDFFAPQRRDGTLRAYRQHHVAKDALCDAGQQDLTAHVNFAALRSVGELCGLTTERLATQAQFLVAIAEQTWREPHRFPNWTAERFAPSSRP